MLKILYFLVVCIYLSLATTSPPPHFPQSATQLTIGGTYHGRLLTQTSEDFGIPSLFYVQVPETIEFVTLTLSMASYPSVEQCDGLSLIQGEDGYPCAIFNPPFSTSPSVDYCTYNGTSGELNIDPYFAPTASLTFGPGPHTNPSSTYFVSGGYLYLGVVRQDNSNATVTCPFSLSVNISNCPITLPIATHSNRFECAPLTVIPEIPTGFPFVDVLDATHVPSVYKLDLPIGVASVTIEVDLSLRNVSVYASNDEASTAAACHGSTGSDYSLILTCIGITSGPFYVFIPSARDQGMQGQVLVGAISISTVVCNGDQVGYACNSIYFSATQMLTSSGITLSIPRGQNAFGFIDTSSRYANEFYQIYKTQTTGNVTFAVLRDGFPTTRSQQIPARFPTESFNVSPFELSPYIPESTARMYFGVLGCNVTTCNVHLHATSFSIAS